MPPSNYIANWKSLAADEWAKWEAEEEANTPLFLRTSWVPVSAQQHHVNDLQQWIDLCA
jgi:hypothetical protein